MDEKRLIRILAKKLETYSTLGSCLLQQQVAMAVHEAMVETSRLENLITQLRTRIVQFSYWKNDGTRRVAIGTLKPSILDKISAGEPPRRRSQKESNYIVYYDLAREDWRCFCPENFICIN